MAGKVLAGKVLLVLRSTIQGLWSKAEGISPPTPKQSLLIFSSFLYFSYFCSGWGAAGKININCCSKKNWGTIPPLSHLRWGCPYRVMYGRYLVGINSGLMMSLTIPPVNLTLCWPCAHTNTPNHILMHACHGSRSHSNTHLMCTLPYVLIQNTLTHWGAWRHRAPNQPEWLPGPPTPLQGLFIRESQLALQVVAAYGVSY